MSQFNVILPTYVQTNPPITIKRSFSHTHTHTLFFLHKKPSNPSISKRNCSGVRKRDGDYFSESLKPTFSSTTTTLPPSFKTTSPTAATSSSLQASNKVVSNVSHDERSI
eukprot:m.32906 g.32906  ORF g.32906 m.32906 type:complete len:110 (-) comp6419_c0_seq2:1957-2286(-)